MARFIVRALCGLYTAQNVVGYFLIFVAVPATWDVVVDAGWMETVARGYFLSLFFLLCLEGVFFLRLPSRIPAILSLLVPNYLFIGLLVWQGEPFWSVLVQGAFVYTTPIVIAWAISFLFVGGWNFVSTSGIREGSGVMGICFLIFSLPAFAAMFLYWRDVLSSHVLWELIALGMIVLINVVHHARLAMIGASAIPVTK